MEKERRYPRKLVLTMRAILSLLLILTPFISLTAQGNWTSGAWPSTNSYTFQDPSLYVVSTNYWSKVHVDSWSQESTGSDIPAVTIQFGPFGDISSACSTIGRPIPSLDFFSYHGEIGLYTNSSTRNWENTSLLWTQAEVPATNLVGNGFLGFYNITYPLYDYSDGWLGRSAGTSFWTNNYSATNEFMYEEEIVIGQTTNLVTNTLTTVLSGYCFPSNTSIKLDVPFVWPHDTYLALRERWVFNNPTNDFFEEGPTFMKPLQHGTKTLVNVYTDNPSPGVGGSFCRAYRDVAKHNLNNFKIFIEDELRSGRWVDKSKADTNGLFESYFNETLLWEFVYDPVIGSNMWKKTKKPVNFPRYKFEAYSSNEETLSFTNLPWFPYEVVTNVYVDTVTGTESPRFKGWEASPPQLFSELASVGSTVIVTNLVLDKTWFDWSPNDDFGGWLPELPNTVVDGTHEIPIDMTLYPTTAVFISDSCIEDPGAVNPYGPNDYYYFRLHELDASNEVESVEFTLFKISNAFGVPDILIESNVLTESTVYTNYFTCTNSFIADGFTEADYGYAIMPQMVDLLHWTASDDYMDITNVYNRRVESEVPSRVTNEYLSGSSDLFGALYFPDAFVGCDFTNLEGPYLVEVEKYLTIQEDLGAEWVVSNGVPSQSISTTLFRERRCDINQNACYFRWDFRQGSYGFSWAEDAITYRMRQNSGNQNCNPPLFDYPLQCECVDSYCYVSKDESYYSVEIPEREWYNTSTRAYIRESAGEPFEDNLSTDLSAVSDLYRFDSSIQYTHGTNVPNIEIDNSIPQGISILSNCFATYETDFFTICETFDCISGYFTRNTANGSPGGDNLSVFTNDFNDGLASWQSRSRSGFTTQTVFYALSDTKPIGEDTFITSFEYPFLTEPSESNYVENIYANIAPTNYPISKTNSLFYTELIAAEYSDGRDTTKFKVLHKWDFEYTYPYP